MIKAIVFDFDDTLVPYKEVGIKAHQDTAKKLGLRIPSDKEIGDLFGLPWDKFIKLLWPDANTKVFREKYHSVKYPIRTPIPGAIELINKLHAKGMELYILSSRHGESLNDLTKKTLPIEKFKGIYSSDDTKFHKPDARVFHRILEDYDPEEIVFVGDTLYDAQAAKNAGITFVGFVCVHATKEEFEKEGADYIISKLEDFPDFS